MTDQTEAPLRTVLVVDDTAENLALLSAVLAGHYKVKVANSGVRGIAIAQGDAAPDLILLDVMMPGMDGLETCRRLKAHASSAAIPVIFLSGKTDALEEEQGLDAGAADYIHKPINPAMVLRRIETQLRLAAAEHASAVLGTEVAARQRDIDELARAMETFESIVTHDARSSLSVINGYASLLRKKAETAGDAQATQFLTSIRDGAKKVSSLTTQWRDTSRTLRRLMRPADLDMDAMAKAALQELLEGCEAHSSGNNANNADAPDGSACSPRITIDTLPHAWADAAAVKLVFRHLIQNALTYTRPGERAVLRIHAEPGDAENIFYIDDEGIGLGAGEDASIFAPFHRVNEELAPENAGLGLFVAQQAVMRNGGRIWAAGETGKGTRLSFSLPRTEPLNGVRRPTGDTR